MFSFTSRGATKMSVCETAKTTYIRTRTELSASINFDKQAGLFPKTLCSIFFFFLRCVLRNYEVIYFKRDTPFLKRHKAD